MGDLMEEIKVMHGGYKNSVLGLIPREWEIKAIAEVGMVSSGGTPDTSNESYWNGNISWCTPTDIGKLKGNKFIDKTSLKITESGLKSCSSKLLPVNSLIICTRATIGKVAINIFPISTNQGFKNVIPKNNINIEYLYYTILNSENQLIKIASGSTFLEISKTDFDKFQIRLPSIEEQKAIADCLSTWDKAIEKLNQLIAQKELRKKGLMQELLTGKKRLRGFDGEWEVVKLKDVFERVTRKNSEVNTNVVTISAQRGFVRQKDFFKKTIASDILDNYFLVNKGEFCYNKSYSNGYPWGATKRLNDFEKAVVTTLYICFGIKNEDENSGDFFEQYFNANLLDTGLTKIAHEGGRAHGLLNVTPSDFFNLKLAVPDYNEQVAIAKVLQSADKEIQLLKNKLEQLKMQKKGLMQVLLTGKKRLIK